MEGDTNVNDEDTHIQTVNDDDTHTQTVNTDNPDYNVSVSRRGSDEIQVADFTAGPFVTRRNPIGEITSMLSSLYISEDEGKSDDDDESCGLNVNVVQTMQIKIDKLKVDLLALSAEVQNNEHDFKQSGDSALNHETSFREAVDASLADLEDHFHRSIEKLERAVTDCLLRRDARWEIQMKKL